ncbi:hypothetical protein [Rhizobium sp. PAMB 3182]
MLKIVIAISGVLMLAAAASASATELDFSKLKGQYPYKDLPGVETFGTSTDTSAKFRCETATRQFRFHRYDDDDGNLLRNNRSLPRLVYRCSNGVYSVESTRTPYPSTKRSD